MRSRNLTLAVAALVVLVTVDQVRRFSGHPALPGGSPAPPSPTPTPGRAALPARTDPGPRDRGSEMPFLATDPTGIRDAIGAAGTTVYLPAMFAETDSSIRRWDDADADKLRVAFVLDPIPGWTPDDRRIALAAMDRWEGIGIGVRFTEVLDSTGAQIVIRWLPRFAFDRTGQTDLEWDHLGRVRHALIQLALADHDGHPLPPDALRAVALHEVGHALGLPHSDRRDDLMYPTTSVPELSARDLATVRLLYRLPILSIKWSAPSPSP